MQFEDGVSILSRMLSIQRENPFHLIIVIGLLLVGIFSLSAVKGSRGYNDFKNDKNERIKELNGDTRFKRFSHAQELSQEGKELAGDDPYMVQMGSVKELVLFSPDQLQDYLHKAEQDHFKPPNLNFGDYFGRLLGVCVGLQNGPKWKSMRRHFDPEFSFQASTNMIPLFSKHINNWLDDLPKNPISQNQNGAFVQDMMKASKHVALRLISLTMYGEAFDEADFLKIIELSELHDNLMGAAIFGKPLTYAWFNKLPTKFRRQLNNFLSEWEKLNLRIIQGARQNNSSCPAERMYRAVESGEMSMLEYTQTLDEILFTNIDITGTVLGFLLINLSINPTFQSSLRSEILQNQPPQSPTYLTSQTTLLHYSTLESLRISPALAFSPAEYKPHPRTISNYSIPAFTPIVIDVRRLNTHPSIWSPDPEVFRPARFAQMTPSHWRYGMVRWGLGTGKCLGKNMADLMLKMATVAVLGRYELRAFEGKGEEGEGKRTGAAVVADGRVVLGRI